MNTLVLLLKVTDYYLALLLSWIQNGQNKRLIKFKSQSESLFHRKTTTGYLFAALVKCLLTDEKCYNFYDDFVYYFQFENN